MNSFPTAVHYHHGQNLSSALFRSEQEYHLTARERHNLTAHEWGIALGLELTGDAVGPGVAIDGYGRELVLPVRTQFDRQSAFDLYGVDSLDVALVYDRAVQPPGDVVLERPRIVLGPAAEAGADRRSPPDGAPLDAISAATRPAPHDLAHPWPVHLGTVTRDPTDPTAAPAVGTDGRPYIGVRAERVDTPDGTAALVLGTEVTVRAPAQKGQAPKDVLIWRPKGSAPRAGLVIDGELSVAGGVTVTEGPVRLPAAQVAVSPAGWKIEHVKPTAQGAPEQLRLVLGNPPGAVNRTEFVVGATVDGAFTPCLTVAADGTVTVHGNLVVNGDTTLKGQVST
ncbi:hypothetical protein ACI78V_09240 [Geodermatophilus sp. SYSU D00742]